MAFFKKLLNKVKKSKIEIKISEKECPCCHKKFEKIPKKTTNCIYCGERIYARIRVKGRKKVLVNLAGVKQIDDEWVKYALQSSWFKVLKRLGVTKEDYMRIHDKLTKSWGFYPRHGDIFWGLFGEIYLNAAKEGNKEQMDIIAKLRNEFRDSEHRGEKI